jgi:hypothetical protein
MKSNVKKINGYFVCSTIFGKNNEFEYISKFKSDLKGVAYQELKTAAIDKDKLNEIKNKGCKNIETELKKLGYEVSGQDLLDQRRLMLEKARNQDVKGQTPEEKFQYHTEKIARLEAELAQAKKDFEEDKKEMLKTVQEAEKRTAEMIKKIKELSK